MRVVISGTHASGKSTLIADFAALHPDFEVFPDPYELIDDVAEEPDAGAFFAQLEVAAERLVGLAPESQVLAERGPLDFVAYLDALDQLWRPTRSGNLFQRGLARAAAAMKYVDLLVVLPLAARDHIEVSTDEDPELRSVMNDSLLELVDDQDLVGDAHVVELSGDRTGRLAQLEEAIQKLASYQQQ